MYCGNCGAQVPEGRKFCTNCGSPVDFGRPGTSELAGDATQANVTQPLADAAQAPAQEAPVVQTQQMPQVAEGTQQGQTSQGQPDPQQPLPQASQGQPGQQFSHQSQLNQPQQVQQPTGFRANLVRNIALLVVGIALIGIGIFRIYNALAPSAEPEPEPVPTPTPQIIAEPTDTPTNDPEPTGDDTTADPEPTGGDTTTTEPTGAANSGTLTPDGRYLVTGIILIMDSDSLAEVGGVDPSGYNSSDQYAILILDEAVPMSLQNGDGSGLRDPEYVTMICVGSTAHGDVDDWAHYEDGHTIAVAIDPNTTWWPTDVSLPIGQPSTSTAQVAD